MNSVDINSFFFNLIPGSICILGTILILLFFKYISLSSLTILKNEGLIIVAFAILALFLGFFFQGFTKIIRRKSLDDAIARTITLKKSGGFLYKKGAAVIRNNLGSINYLSLQDMFHLMDNFLRANNSAVNVIHFSSRFSLWANLFWVALALLLLFTSISFRENIWVLNSFLIIILLFSFTIYALKQAILHHFSYFDVILKTFVILEVKKQD